MGRREFAQLDELKRRIAELSEQADHLRTEPPAPPDSSMHQEHLGQAAGQANELPKPLPLESGAGRSPAQSRCARQLDLLGQPKPAPSGSLDVRAADPGTWCSAVLLFLP